MNGKPIVLQDEGQANQSHDVLRANERVSGVYIDVRDIVSNKDGNALRLGSDGKLYIHQCCG